MKDFVRQIEWIVRHAIVYPALRMVLNNHRINGPVDIKHVKKILILRYDRIGDIIVTTPVFRALKKVNPQLYLGLLASESNAELVRFNHHIDKIHTLHSSWWALWKELKEARRTGYDVVLNLIFNRTTTGGLLANIIAPKGIKIGQGDEKYRFYFNLLLKLERGKKHMAEILASIAQEAFGVSMRTNDIEFEIAIDADSERTVDAFVRAIRKGRSRLVVVNISATDGVRKISADQADAIVRLILEKTKHNVVVIGAPHEVSWRDQVVRTADSARCRAYPEGRVASLLEIAALIGKADAVVTPDTSIVHVASAMKTPVIGFFTPLQMAAEWLPYKVKQRTVFASSGKPVSSIPLLTIEREVLAFLKKAVQS